MPARDRLKQQLIRDLVRENLDTVAGAPPPGLGRRRLPVSRWLLGGLGATLVVAFSGSLGNTAFRFGAPRPGSAPRAASAPPAPDAALPAPQEIDPALFQLAVRRIVLDPGHGGTDPGAVTPSGLDEKTLTLDIAQRLRALLKDAPISVVMTRSDDRTVSLERRVEIANAENADLFLSIHINSMPIPDKVGIETFYLGHTRDPETARFARTENAGSGYSLADFKTLLEGVYAGVRQEESRRFAATMQSGLFRELAGANDRLLDRGVKTAPLVVLVGTRMPAILAEVSCVSNADEARRLATPAYRSEVARALFAGIRAYVDPSHAAPAALARRGAAAAISKGDS